jgi:hypothetical protein
MNSPTTKETTMIDTDPILNIARLERELDEQLAKLIDACDRLRELEGDPKQKGDAGMTGREIVERIVELNEERHGDWDPLRLKLLMNDFAFVLDQVPEARRAALENISWRVDYYGRASREH